MGNAPNAWRDTALAFELRAMRVEYVIRLLVAAGHVTQEKVDAAFDIARDFKAASLVQGTEATAGGGASYPTPEKNPTPAYRPAGVATSAGGKQHE
jgi:hypothetical protein